MAIRKDGQKEMEHEVEQRSTDCELSQEEMEQVSGGAIGIGRIESEKLLRKMLPG